MNVQNEKLSCMHVPVWRKQGFKGHALKVLPQNLFYEGHAVGLAGPPRRPSLHLA